jgi:hypothetical protein
VFRGVALVLPIAILSTLITTSSAFAQSTIQLTQQTSSYRLMLVIGPVEEMSMPNQGMGSMGGEVMAPMPGLPMPSMTTTDQGHAVNHHLEVHVYDKTSGSVVRDQVPTIALTTATGMSHPVAPVVAMYGTQQGQSDWHFGNNVYLADGTYTITVTVNGQTATFKNVAIGVAALPTSLPRTGVPASLFALLTALSVAFLLLGLRFRRA